VNSVNSVNLICEFCELHLWIYKKWYTVKKYHI